LIVDYGLDIIGTIRVKEIKVETSWADFVFTLAYKPRSLSEIEHVLRIIVTYPKYPRQKKYNKME
jgi:hypothetical protein